jgi:hypothetical protein
VNSAAVSLVIQAPPDFSLGPATGSSVSQTVTAGQTATFALALSPSGSFTGTVDLTCTITPNVSRAPTCSIPSSLQISSSGSQSVSVSVGTTAATASNALSQLGFPPAGSRLFWTFTLIGMALLFTLRRKRVSVLAKATMVVTVVCSVACGGGRSDSHTTQGTPAGTYATTITASSGTLNHSATLTLVVQ